MGHFRQLCQFIGFQHPALAFVFFFFLAFRWSLRLQLQLKFWMAGDTMGNGFCLSKCEVECFGLYIEIIYDKWI